MLGLFGGVCCFGSIRVAQILSKRRFVDGPQNRRELPCSGNWRQEGWYQARLWLQRLQIPPRHQEFHVRDFTWASTNFVVEFATGFKVAILVSS